MKLQRGVHSYFKIVPLETDQKFPSNSIISPFLSFFTQFFFLFFSRKENSLWKIPRDTLLLRGKAVLYIVACQFLTFEDRSGLKLNFPANLLREREWFCNRVDIIVSCVTLHEKRKKIFFPPIIETRSKGKGRKNGEERKIAIACSWWFESESEEYTVLITATGAFSRQKDQLLSTDF